MTPSDLEQVEAVEWLKRKAEQYSAVDGGVIVPITLWDIRAILPLLAALPAVGHGQSESLRKMRSVMDSPTVDDPQERAAFAKLEALRRVPSPPSVCESCEKLRGELMKTKAALGVLQSTVDAEFSDADERVSISRRGNYFVHNIPGSESGPFASWREAYRHAEGLLDYQEQAAKLADLMAQLTASQAACREKDAEIERVKAEVDAAECATLVAGNQVMEQAARITALESQLPEGMKHCTIRFIECEKGHGRLMADNWVDHGCLSCQLAQARADAEALEGRYEEVTMTAACPSCKGSGRYQITAETIRCTTCDGAGTTRQTYCRKLPQPAAERAERPVLQPTKRWPP